MTTTFTNKTFDDGTVDYVWQGTWSHDGSWGDASLSNHGLFSFSDFGSSPYANVSFVSVFNANVCDSVFSYSPYVDVPRSWRRLLLLRLTTS